MRIRMRDKSTHTLSIVKTRHLSKYSQSGGYQQAALNDQEKTPCVDYTENGIAQLEQRLFELNHENVKFLHNVNCSFGDFAAVESCIKIGPVAVLQKGSDQKIYGVYAKTALNFPLNLGVYLGETHQTQDSDDDSDLLYSFGINRTTAINARNMRSWHAMVNGASSEDTANIFTISSGGKIYYHLKRSIKPEEQFLVYYGDDYTFVDKRFLNANDNWEEASEKFKKHEVLYKTNQSLDDKFLSLFNFKDALFVVPDCSALPYGLTDLPVLAYTNTPDNFLPQNQQENMTLLHLACWGGDIDIVTHLLKEGANPNQQTSISGYCALHVVVLSDNTFVQKKKLIDLIMGRPGASLRLQDMFDRTILHLAIETHQLELIKYLLALDKKRNSGLEVRKSLKACLNEKMQCYILLAIEMNRIHVLNELFNHITPDEIRFYSNNPDHANRLIQSLQIARSESTEKEWESTKQVILSLARNCEQTRRSLAQILDCNDVQSIQTVAISMADTGRFPSLALQTSESSNNRLDVNNSALSGIKPVRPIYDEEFEQEITDYRVKKLIDRTRKQGAVTFFDAVIAKQSDFFRTKAILFQMARVNILSLHQYASKLQYENATNLSNVNFMIAAYNEFSRLIMINMYFLPLPHEQLHIPVRSNDLHDAILKHWPYAFINAVHAQKINLFISNYDDNDAIKEMSNQYLLRYKNNASHVIEELMLYATHNVHFINTPAEKELLKFGLKNGLDHLQNVYEKQAVDCIVAPWC